MFEVVWSNHVELYRAPNAHSAVRRACAAHKLALGPKVITAAKASDREGYRVTFHGGMFGGDKVDVMFVSHARIY